VTAGNASGINDGAAAVVVMSAKKAAALGLSRWRASPPLAPAAWTRPPWAWARCPPSQKALQRAGWKAADVDLFELNEAFAAQACAVNKALGWDPAKVNVNGGAIAIGHPIGASGCRILVTLLHEMQRRDAKKGIAALCIGGGMGVSLALERALQSASNRKLNHQTIAISEQDTMSQKVAYVTGGMGGIGTAICQRLHKDGFKVIAGCGPTRDHAKWMAEQKALGYTFYASVGNVGDWDSTVEAFTKTKAEHGTIDVLVNNAGITRDRMFLKMSAKTGTR
jgi:hypothetical protein